MGTGGRGLPSQHVLPLRTQRAAETSGSGEARGHPPHSTLSRCESSGGEGEGGEGDVGEGGEGGSEGEAAVRVMAGGDARRCPIVMGVSSGSSSSRSSSMGVSTSTGCWISSCFL